MTEKELKKLKKIDLLEMLLAQSKEVENLRTRLEDAERQLQNRRIALEKAGSIAEAALQLNGVFEAAQMAAAQYLDSLAHLAGNSDDDGDKKGEICSATRQRASPADVSDGGRYSLKEGESA